MRQTKVENGGRDESPSRRDLLKVTAGGLIAGGAASLLAISSSSGLAAEPKAGQTLVAYFSRTGNTRSVAEQIHRIAGGDIVEIRTVRPYPEDYRATTEQAKQEQERGFRPELASDIGDLAPYGTVFLGYPNWWSTLPMALFTMLERHRFEGRTIVPFCTHEGSGLGRSVEDVRVHCPSATILTGLALRGGTSGYARTRAAQQSIAEWLATLKIDGKSLIPSQG